MGAPMFLVEPAVSFPYGMVQDWHRWIVIREELRVIATAAAAQVLPTSASAVPLSLLHALFPGRGEHLVTAGSSAECWPSEGARRTGRPFSVRILPRSAGAAIGASHLKC